VDTVVQPPEKRCSPTVADRVCSGGGVCVAVGGGKCARRLDDAGANGTNARSARPVAPGGPTPATKLTGALRARSRASVPARPRCPAGWKLFFYPLAPPGSAPGPGPLAPAAPSGKPARASPRLRAGASPASYAPRTDLSPGRPSRFGSFPRWPTVPRPPAPSLLSWSSWALKTT
jgi:hypothetical protein